MKRGVHLLLLTIITVNLIAQKVVQPDDTLSMLYANSNDSNLFESFPYFDLEEFQHYRPIGKTKLPMARAGNIGLVTHTYELEAQDWDINHLMGGYRPYLMTKNSMRYYKTSRPFTQLRYTNGSEEEQLFQVLHTQNLGEGLNISFEYQRTVSTGYYQRQLTNHTQFNATYNLHSRNHRLYSSAYFLINSMEALENGGTILVRNDDEDTPFLLGVNLRRSQNRGRTQSIGFENKFNLLNNDSTNTILNISHEFDWHKAYRNYESTLGSETFYNNFFLDDSKTADTSFAQNISNTLRLNALNNRISVGIRNEQYHYFQNYLIDKKFSSNYLIASVFEELSGLPISITIEKGINGYFKEELDIKSKLGLGNWKGWNNELTIHISKKRPDYFLQHQRTNHILFDQNLKTSNHNSVSLESVQEDWKFKSRIGLRTIENYLYIDTLQFSRQLDDDITSFFIEVEKDFSFMKHLRLKNKLLLQSISNKEIVPLPELLSFHSLYYENNFFKKSLLVQIGIDAYYIGSYNGYSYSPTSAQFILRENNIKELGNIVQLDVFMKLRINKSARIFVKMENANSSSFSENTNRILNNPIPGRSMKVGLSWRMLN